MTARRTAPEDTRPVVTRHAGVPSCLWARLTEPGGRGRKKAVQARKPVRYRPKEWGRHQTAGSSKRVSVGGVMPAPNRKRRSVSDVEETNRRRAMKAIKHKRAYPSLVGWFPAQAGLTIPG